tara:strand:+ start:34 stop:567 length:534 start_codon:yes stop_codon:yes gene_type:complete
MDRGKKAITIDQVPLEWCFNPGVKFDFRHMEDGYVVTANDIKAELKRINYEIKPFDIVLVNTSAGKHYGADDYLLKGCGIGKDATIFLLEKGVKITGTDAWSWDAPFAHTAEKYRQTKDSSIIWEGHRAGMEKAYCHMEKLSSLEKLPDYGYTISCFPFKIKKASAGFIRAVAILDL